MANVKQTKDEALAVINAALSILEKFPDLNTTSESSISINTSTNPFPFLMEAFKSCVGYDILINIISSFITNYLPIVEVSVKAALLSNIKNLLSCSLNPFIPTELLEKGIMFDLNEIDISDTLRYSPLSKNGRYYYFGCEDCKTPDDVRDTAYGLTQSENDTLSDSIFGNKDMNALIWFVKSRGIRREVWGRKTERGENEGFNDKQRKKDGIVTLQYHETNTSLTSATGGPLPMQTPFGNVLHVFLGNVREANDTPGGQEIDNAEVNLKQVNLDIERLLEIRYNAFKKIKKYEKRKKDYERQYKKRKIDNNTYINLCRNTDVHIHDLKDFLYGTNARYDSTTSIVTDVDNLYDSIVLAGDDNTGITAITDYDYQNICGVENLLSGASAQRELEYHRIYTALTNTTLYRPNKLNYYYHRTLIEFNTDYVMSLKLFDEKVIAAQLIDQIIGLLSIDMNLTYKQILIREKIVEMVKMIVETDDAVVSDCFFSFSNDKFNSMLEKTELQKAKLYTSNGEENAPTKIDADKILESLNGLSADATPEERKTIIQGALTEISGTINSFHYEDKDKINFNAQINFIERLFNELACVIALSVLSPKVYLLILVNLRILGEDTNFKLEDFIRKFEQLIVALLRAIRDELIKFLTEELMKILGKLAAEIAIKIGIEQAQYYARLIKKIIACFKRRRKTLDFNIDDVMADIYETEEEPKNNEC